MTLVDTNILLIYILKDDRHLHNDAIKILEGHHDLFVANEVIAEVIYVLTKSYNVSRKNSAIIFTDLLNDNIFQLSSKEIILKAIEMFSEKNLDFVDCILCATNKITGNKVETFDKGLKNCIKG